MEEEQCERGRRWSSPMSPRSPSTAARSRKGKVLKMRMGMSSSHSIFVPGRNPLGMERLRGPMPSRYSGTECIGDSSSSAKADAGLPVEGRDNYGVDSFVAFSSLFITIVDMTAMVGPCSNQGCVIFCDCPDIGRLRQIAEKSCALIFMVHGDSGDGQDHR